MRPSRTVARAALTVALVVAALPGLVGSREPSPARPIDAAQLESVNRATALEQQEPILLDDSGLSDGALDGPGTFAEPGSVALGGPDDRAQPKLAAAKSSWTWKDPRYSLSGIASFYDHGTTAMRDVPRGTTIVVCGGGGCIETVVSDYGPSKAGGRLIDMYRPDFFAICGCGWWSGTTQVTVKVY